MNNDIIPPRPPVNIPPRPSGQPSPPRPIMSPVLPPDDSNNESPLPVSNQQLATEGVVEPTTKLPTPPRKTYVKWALIVISGILLLCVALVAWYLLALRPVSGDEAKRVNVSITSGSSPSQIGEQLQNEKVIRSKVAFNVYTRLQNVGGKLQAGNFSLSPANSTAEIVASLTSGEAEQFNITFYPGATLNIASTSADKTPSHRQVLQKLGYSDDEITEAFNASYAAEYPLLFSDKPATADLEGYVYGQTYRIASGSSVKQILMRTFDEYETQIKANNLVEMYKAHGLSLYEGITLASIIQREVSRPEDQKQVAQVFYKRLAIGMQLGADATFVYAAGQLNVAPSVDLDSPYNTRKYNGLPPGPISSPGLGALQAVAAPAAGDYLYFVSGDDGKNYFSHTLEEHEAKTAEYCRANCSLF
ncbi:MAG TPA: endolytic transglycosylase MltG [Candidatus Saccharimonadales bacterium]|nr:endolytic transglycosylase MltG [Candidatus Saccharimonadales bacterium]